MSLGVIMGAILWTTLLAWMAALSYFDICFRRLPNWLTLPGAGVVAMVGGVGQSVPMLLGALALAGTYLVVHLIAPGAMGAGDVKLAVGTGGLSAMSGIDAWLVAAIAAPLLTGLVGLVLFASGRRRASVPHGPSMCLATAAVLVAAGWAGAPWI